MEEDTKIKTNNTYVMRVSENFKKLIEELQEIEKQRGHFSCSETSATEILYQKIQKLGGIKK